MALIKCPECGKEVSDQAETCINCGFPIKDMRKHESHHESSKSIYYSKPEVTNTSRKEKSNAYYSRPNNNVVRNNNDNNKENKNKKIISICIIIFLCFVLLKACFSVGGNTNNKQVNNQMETTSAVEENVATSETEDDIESVAVEESTGPVETPIEEISSEQSEQESLSELSVINPEMTVEEIKNMAVELPYKDVMRNPDDYIGKYYWVDAKIFTVESGSWYSSYERAYKAFTNDEYDFWTGNLIYILDNRDENSDDYLKILQDDIVRVYGKFNGLVEIKNYINNTKGEEMGLDIIYAELLSE